MSSYLDLGNGQIQMPFGVLGGVTSREHYTGGELKAVKLSERNVVLTHIGELFPVYTETPRRKNIASLEFFRSGLVRSAALEEQQEVTTPIGELPAEFVTFYDTGELHRIFPVNGQLSGFWSEEDEKGLAIPLSFDLGFTAFTALLTCICFYKSGDIKSVTLFPGETISVDTAYGKLTIKDGFSMYESGALRSVEPDMPVKIETSIGTIVAFDPQSNGITADSGSVTFGEDGNVIKLATVANRFAVQTGEGKLFWHEPVAITHPCSDEQVSYQAMQIEFDYDSGNVTITDSEPHEYPIRASHFTISAFSTGELGCSPSDCAGCSLCSGQ